MKKTKKGRFIREYLDNVRLILEQLPTGELEKAIEMLENAYIEGRKIFIIGNGGSAATALHMANDLSEGIAKSAKHGFRVICLSSNVATITAIANDKDYSEIFSSQLNNLSESKDILIVFSGSGNSPNIVRALETARERGLKTIAFLGKKGGKALKVSELVIVVPSDKYGPIEDTHLIFDHLITSYFCNKYHADK